MYIKRKLKNTYINFQICEFLQPQNKGVKTAVKISVSTARIESRATDISLGRISGALAGASHWNKNIQIEKAVKRDKLQNAATALRAQYGFGENLTVRNESMYSDVKIREFLRSKNSVSTCSRKGAVRLQLESILKGDTVLAKRGGKGSDAETVTKDGKRTVYLDNYKETMSREEKLAMGITLGHEAYRDGLVGTEQQQFMETTRAVIGHTEMALRMQADKRYSESMDSIIGGSDILQKDIAAYKGGDLMTMIGHVAGNYDWSKDYWRVLKNGDIVDDLHDDQVSFEDGRETLYIGKGKQGTLEEYLKMERGSGYTELMKEAGFTYSQDSNGNFISWTSQGHTIKAEAIRSLVKTNKVKNLEAGISKNLLQRAVIGIENGKKRLVNSTVNKAKTLGSSVKASIRSINTEKVPGKSLEFWNLMMDSETMAQYDKDNNGGTPQCNNYVGDSIKSKFREDIYNKVFPDGVSTANNMFDQFKGNPNLKVIDTNKYTVDDIQAMADKGVLIIMAFKNPNPKESGHLAFVAHSKVRMMSSPKNYKGTNLPQSGFGEEQSFKSAYPILSQAGEVTGNVTAAWGIPGWNDDSKVDDLEYRKYLLKNYVCFYTVVK